MNTTHHILLNKLDVRLCRRYYEKNPLRDTGYFPYFTASWAINRVLYGGGDQQGPEKSGN